MRILILPFRLLYLVYAFSLFVVLMIPVFICSLAATLFGRIKGGNLVYAACRIWADIWFPLIFIWHRNIYRHKPVKNKSYIFVANHLSYLDAAIIPKVFRHSTRPLGKAEISKVPIFGTIYKNAIVTVDRSSAGNRAKSVLVLKSILRKGISVLVFPEGTFNESGKPLKDFFDGAFRIAIETGTPVQPVLLPDVYDRMHSSSVFSLNPGRSRAVFLPPVPVEGYSLKEVPLLREKVYQIMENELRLLKVSWIKEP